MKITNYTNRMNKPFRTNDDNLTSITESMVKSQVSTVAQQKKGVKTTATKTQRTKTTKPSPKATIVQAKIDVGFGNSLFIRGQGAELGWNKGLPLQCLDRSTWVWSTNQAKDKVVFKLLLNDQVWSQGEDIVVEPGKKIEIVPEF